MERCYSRKVVWVARDALRMLFGRAHPARRARRAAMVTRPRAMVARAETSRVSRAPRAATRGAPRAMPIGAARMSSELRAARTWASAPGGLASWNTPMDSDIHGPQIIAPAVNAARPIHSGVGRPNGTSARPQPRTMAVITGHTGQRQERRAELADRRAHPEYRPDRAEQRGRAVQVGRHMYWQRHLNRAVEQVEHERQ